MKELITLDKIVTGMEEESKVEKVIKSPLADIKISDFDGGSAIFKINKNEVKATNSHVIDVLNRLDIPHSFYSSCSEKLQQEVFNEFTSKNKKEAKFVSLKDNLIAILDSKVPYVSMYSILKAIQPELKESTVERFERTKYNNVINIVTKVQSNPPKKVGDFTRGGLSVEHDVTGRYGTFVYGFMYTLKCTNGLITEDRSSINIRKYGDGDSGLYNKLVSAVQKTISSIKEKRLPEFMKTDEVKVTDPASMIHRISSENHIPARIEQQILDRVPEIANNTTMYDVISLITNVANGMKYSQMRRLQRLGGEAIFHTSRCPTCKSML